MKDGKINTNKLRISKFVNVLVFFLFVIFIVVLGYRCLVDYQVTDSMTISEFINNRNIVSETILPERGTIYDRNGNALAENVSSYTLIAYLDKSRTEDYDNPRHVIDKEGTAKKLAEYIDTEYDRILEILNKDAYQVEFGTGGKNLTQLEMEEIRDLNLPGIDFIKNTKRYYPNGDFASYLLGYTKDKEINGNLYMVGELGIEKYYNEELTGSEGYLTYERDVKGNKIANSNEYKEDAIDGNDIYLTIDDSIQLFIESAVKKAQEDSDAEWIVMGVMDAKTGAILGYSSTPSYDPNIKNLTNYLDPLVSYAYEPGSTMKTFSYMCAIESGKYNGSDTFMSGSKTYESATDKNDKVTIKDWNDGEGWGIISYDRGYAMSSNIGVANLLENVITKNELKACYTKYGFGEKTNITLGNELSGDIDFTYDVEAATAGYGQGITVTPIQILQGLTAISNNGDMLEPYIVDKIVDSNGNVILQNERVVKETIASEETIDKIKSLMRSVIVSDSTMGTGSAYYMEDYDLIGKTGTASIYENGKYLSGNYNYIYSFSGLYPGDDPEVIIYMAMKKPKNSSSALPTAVKDIVVNISKYLNIDNSKKEDTKYLIDNYQNETVTSVSKELKNNGIEVITLGTGNKVINQYPSKGTTLTKGDRVILLTNNYDKTMINFKGISYKECKNILDLMGVKYTLTGYGYAYEQNIEAGKKIDDNIEIKFKNIYD